MGWSEEIPLYLTFDDILILPNYSEVKPFEVDVSTHLTRSIKLNIPIVSAAMDTVTGAKMAIELAKLGGIGIIHRNMTPEEQVSEVVKVKKYETWIIRDPVTITPDRTVADAKRIMDERNISGLPVVQNGYLKGIVTRRDLRFEFNLSRRVEEVMTPLEKLITVKEGIDMKTAKELMHRWKVEKLPVVDEEGKLKGLITLKDISKAESNPLAVKDREGRLLVGAAVGAGADEVERAKMLARAGVDVIVIDSAHAHTKDVLETIRKIKEETDVDVIGGNVGTYEGARDVARAGADAVKVGIGPGSICTTRVMTGVGVPQVSAIVECARACREFGIPLIADGGIRMPGDVAKAIAVGANCVMLGKMLAGTDEAPGEKITYKGKTYKVYRGMGSEEAIRDGMRKGVRSRYLESESILPEGVVALEPYKGPVRSVVTTLVLALKTALGYVGAKNIEEFHRKARVIRQTFAGLRESHAHDVIILKENPLYHPLDAKQEE